MAVQVKERLPYAVELHCDQKETRHWRHPWCIDKNGGELAMRPEFLDNSMPCTIPACFNTAAQRFAKKQCMGTRPILSCTTEGKKIFWHKDGFEWQTFAEVHENVIAAAKGLLGLEGVHDSGKDCDLVAGILADTSAEWQMAAQAVFQIGIPVTTVYTTLGHEAMVHALRETECCVLFLDWAQFEKLRGPVLSKCPALRHLVFIGKCWSPKEMLGDEKQVPGFPIDFDQNWQVGSARATTFECLVAQGKHSKAQLDAYAPKETDRAFIMYTSGSTGLPKGVILTHLNFVSLVAGVYRQEIVKPTPDDTYIAYLPLAHIMELMVEMAVMCAGSRMGYGHAKTLTSSSPFIHPANAENSDLLALRPTFMVAVPAILDLIKTGLTVKLQKEAGLKGKLLRGAVRRAQGLSTDEGCTPGILLGMGLSRVLLSKLKQKMGLENLRLIGSGGAPLSPETQRFVTRVLAPVAQGYGATETTGAATVQEVVSVDGRPVDDSCGMVGPPQPSCELKLRSVPDMGYLVTDSPPRGEILLGGHNVSQEGYFKMPDKTTDDFPVHPDGRRWFHTGDIGVMMPNGTLKIVDRKKDLIKLSGGEYVSLGKVEAALKQVPGIGACVVFAQSDKDHCVCIVSQPEKGWAAFGGKPASELVLAQEIERVLRSQGLARFEIPTKVKLDDELWTPENGLTTASMKVQRNPLREFYNKPGGLLDQLGYRFPEA